MSRVYLDTSLLLQAHASQPWLISPWVCTELASAFALQARRGAITLEEAQEAWRRFGLLREDRLQTLPLAAEDFDTAAHLCLRLNLQLASFDRGLCQAADHHQVANQQLLIPS